MTHYVAKFRGITVFNTKVIALLR